jgi:hypothetical protein
VHFGEIFGCEDWAIQQIARITNVHVLIARSGYERKAHPYVLPIGSELRPYLECSLDRELRKIVTRAYTYMAIAYLHLVVHGFEQFDLLGSIVPAAVTFLQQQTLEHLLGAMAAALFVLGTVASQVEDTLFFRESFMTPPVADPCLPHRTRILPILATTWEEEVAKMSRGAIVLVSQDVSYASERFLTVHHCRHRLARYFTPARGCQAKKYFARRSNGANLV